jgi:N-acyl-L-homoserine lactone synthetase
MRNVAIISAFNTAWLRTAQRVATTCRQIGVKKLILDAVVVATVLSIEQGEE